MCHRETSMPRPTDIPRWVGFADVLAPRRRRALTAGLVSAGGVALGLSVDNLAGVFPPAAALTLAMVAALALTSTG